ncbi:MAG TPA: M14 family metallopeptidase, partial [Cyclobacteriaceae bacterium]
MNLNKSRILIGFLFLVPTLMNAQDLLPPVNAWNGKSVELIAKPDNEFITVAEKTNFTKTSTYDETVQWFKKLATKSTIKMLTIGKSLQGRDIVMIIASKENAFDAQSLRSSSKPLLFAQAGIHAGEIDGKDAGMMLLRDIAAGKKGKLLDKVNIAFIPILSTDAHERSSAYNRINQRGPDNMGWRVNAKNYNLNRDYAKLDSEEIRAVVSVMNEFDPELYLDLHVTDGEDYQYDITYGFAESSLASPAIAAWLESTLKPAANKSLQDHGHIPGPLVFAVAGGTMEKGNFAGYFQPRFSNGYGDLRHIPSILVENHSLKPYKQRVLGTYVFLESVLQKLGEKGIELQSAISKDEALRADSLTVTFQVSTKPETQTHLGIESRIDKSAITGADYVVWTSKKQTMQIPLIRENVPNKKVKMPKTYWVPSTHPEIINRLKLHGINMEIITTPQSVQVSMYRASNQKFEPRPSQGHMIVSAD